jgi:hypothetical protein
VRDPTRRSPGSWPRDRPIQWRGVFANLTQFVVGSAAGLLQLGLVIPVLVVAASGTGDGFGGFVRVGLALMWGALTLFAGWSWLLGRWRVVTAPVLTAAVLVLASAAFPG